MLIHKKKAIEAGKDCQTQKGLWIRKVIYTIYIYTV